LKLQKLGLPYQGSKRNIADEIIDYILKYNPNTEYVYDLFGGGGAISFNLLQRNQIKKVFYNELNTGVCELLKDIQKNGVTDKYYQWIDRDTFNKHKKGNDWFGGLCKCVWSFGNNQDSYLFGKNVEEYKKNYHLVVINGLDKLKEMEDYCMSYVFDKYGIKQDLKLTMPVKENYQERRLEIGQQLNVFEKNCKLRVYDLQKLQQLQRLERLEQLERLQRLERLEQLERLQMLNMDYKDVIIATPIDKTIIYLDPPYKNTGGYQEVICHNELMDYIKNSPYKIYISSYELEGYESVLNMNKRCTLSAIANNVVVEKLFCNREETFIPKNKKVLF
jgi:site-specific DNA-adenine methylase